ncbi:MAG: CapA family protein [Carboxylicivirga sp.]|jgi:poly-gamma-glutamate synthesis protein (capsule biosynthesis protein)|nr:CapA family protein [Carboxylicivirga sp.]
MRYLILLFLIGTSNLLAQRDTTISLVFMGDVMGHDTQINSARINESDRFDYHSCFKFIKEDIKSADLAIANLEVTLAGPPFKGYPAFSSPDTLIDALIDAGIDGLVMANNHCVDRRKKGLIRTCDVLDGKGMPRTGVFKDSLDRVKHNPMILESKGVRLAILNYTYGTNGIKVQSPNIVNELDTAIMSSDITSVRKQAVDEIIVCLHWGWEYQTKPNPNQKMLASFLKSKGINIIIGSHPHVLQPMVMDSSQDGQSLVAYSMGNFISNQRTAPRDGAALIFVDLQVKNGEVSLSNTQYQLTWVYTPYEGGKKRFYVLPATRYEDSLWVEKTARKRMNDYISEARDILKLNRGVREKRFDLPLCKLDRLEMDLVKINVPSSIH